MSGSIFRTCHNCGATCLKSDHHKCPRIRYNPNPHRPREQRQPRKNPYDLDVMFGKGILNDNIGFKSEPLLPNYSFNFGNQQQAREGMKLLRNDFANARKSLAPKFKGLASRMKRGNGSYYVMTERDGVTIRHNFNNLNKAKQFKELAEASGSYNRVSNSVNEQP